MSQRHPASIRCMALGLLLVLGLSVIASAAGAEGYDQAGGDDILIASDSTFRGDSPSMDIAEDGDIYVAVAAIGTGGTPEIRVYRSQDAGDSFPLWGTIFLSAAPALAIDSPCVHIGEGTQNRIYVAHRFRGPSDANFSIRVASSPLHLASASWSISAAMSQAGVDFQSPTIHSDEMSNADYRVYVAAMGSGLDGSDVWFTRSITFGATFEAAYQVFSSTTGDGYFYPEVRYGRNGVIHCVCYFRPIATPGQDYAACYRRAVSYGMFGPAGWEAAVNMSSSTDGYDEFHVSVAASHANDDAMIGWAVKDGSGVFQPAEYRLSTDGGLTWPGEPVNSTPDNELPHLLMNDAHARCYAWGNASGSDNFGINYYVSEYNGWSPHWSVMDRPYAGVPNTPTGGQYMDYNATKENRLGFVWMTYSAAGPDSLFFDAYWRTDRGYPNIAPGFPIALSSGVVAPPAICELDYDPESEIVFGTADGKIHVYNHDGTNVGGWPVDIGTFHADATIAVGDIAGDGSNEIVAGSDQGIVYAFNRFGVALSGWPKALGPAAPVYLAIGRISTAARQVVTCCANRVHLINGDGTVAPGFPMQPNTPVSAPPAIGDVDNDGDRDIVILQQNIMNVLTGQGGVQAVRGFAGEGKTFSNAPTLADLDLDGDLEIVAPTDQGDVYVMYGDGSDFAGLWPYHDPSGVRLTSVALADLQGVGTGEPQLVFCQEGPTAPTMHALTSSGVEFTGFPRTTVPGWHLFGMPIVDRLDWTAPEIVAAAQDQNGYACTRLGADVQGWPKWLAGQHHVSPASGDVDGDGDLELVFTSYSPAQLTVVDVQSGSYRVPAFATSWWPMYAYNPERQGCLACNNDDVSDVADGAFPAGSIRFAPPAPNPSSAPVQLQFELPEPAATRLDIFDVHGRLVRRLVKSELPAGPHEAVWDGNGENGVPAAAGSYYLRLMVNGSAGAPATTRRVLLLR